jgi:hypothetical protein
VRRVLSVLVVMAATGAALAVACYSPALSECQFRCGPNDLCPAGTACRGGYCVGSGGSCLGGGDGGAGDASGSSGSDGGLDAQAACPDLLPGASCDPVQLVDGHCFSACSNSSSWQAAGSACGTGWRLAFLDSSGKLGVTGGAAGSAVPYWVGASRDGGTGGSGSSTSNSPFVWTGTMTVVAAELRSNSFDESISDLNCVAIDVNEKLLINDNCSSGYPFVCEKL